MSKPRHIELVTWLDSCGLPDGWQPRSAIKNYRPITVQSVGFVTVHRRYIIVTPHIHPNEVGGFISIPRSAIVKRKRLT